MELDLSLSLLPAVLFNELFSEFLPRIIVYIFINLYCLHLSKLYTKIPHFHHKTFVYSDRVTICEANTRVLFRMNLILKLLFVIVV